MRKPIQTRRSSVSTGAAPRTAPIGGYQQSAPSRMKQTPISVPRTMRNHDVRVLTSLPAGKMVPLAAIPLLREDAVTRCNMRLSFEMMETVEILMNAVNVNVKAYLVPNLALERFQNSLDLLNRSYEGIPFGDDPVVPFLWGFQVPATGSVDVPILKYMGKHARANEWINGQYISAYNAIWNFRAANRSPDITLRNELDWADLAPAFWQHQGFAHIVPDFDQAMIDGEVPLNISSGQMPISGIGVTTPSAFVAGPSSPLAESDGQTHTYDFYAGFTEANMFMKGTAASGFPAIFAELAENGISVSLSNIELAKKTQAFAMLRRQYTGYSDDYIIDLLMDGISIPEQFMAQPILLQDRSTMFGMSKRYATDSANLTESVVNGATFIDLNFSVPKCGPGGVVMVVCEITPEQLFERQKDPYLHALNVDALPQFLRDTLDPEKVSVVPNDYVDLDHDTPAGVFGYAPLNHEWNHTSPCIGGRFYRPAVDAAFDEDRQRIWAVETQNPVLSQDFYLCTNMHTKPFVVTDQDPFEVVIRGGATIMGNTVFGKLLIEASDDYDQVLGEAPMDRIEKPLSEEAEGSGEAAAKPAK